MTVTPDTWWEAAYRGGRVEELEPAECRQLLVSSNVGRLGYRSNEDQRIVPVNYVISDDYLVFRTFADHDIARWVPWRPVAFEVDELDGFPQTGWSVLVSAVAEELPRASLRAMDAGETPEPWAEGVRSLYVRIRLDHLTGRRVHPV
jgi:uncharacterized protein